MKINKIIILFVIILFFPNILFSSINNRVIAKVEDRTITTFELKNKIIISLILSNQEINQQNIEINKKNAMSFLINQRLKEIELSKYKIKIDNNLLMGQIQRIISNNLENFKEKLKKNNLSYDLFEKEIETELLWQQFIFSFYKKKVDQDISILENDLKLNDFNKLQTINYNLSEIEVLLTNAENKIKIIKDIKEKITEIGFEKTAKQVSISPSSINNGSIGWVNSSALSKKISKELEKIKVGEISEPIINPNSIIFLKINEKKLEELSVENKESFKKKLIDDKKNQLLNLYSSSFLSKLKNTSYIKLK